MAGLRPAISFGAIPRHHLWWATARVGECSVEEL
jgi:hypothetical protein